MFTGYFNRQSSTVPDRQLFEEVINTPPSGLNELLYRNLDDSLIRMMEDAKKYDMYKVKPIMNKRKNPFVEIVNTDSESEAEAELLLGAKRFGDVAELSRDTLEEFCKILPHCVSFNSHLHEQHNDSALANCWCPCSPPIWNWLAGLHIVIA